MELYGLLVVEVEQIHLLIHIMESHGLELEQAQAFFQVLDMESLLITVARIHLHFQDK